MKGGKPITITATNNTCECPYCGRPCFIHTDRYRRLYYRCHHCGVWFFWSSTSSRAIAEEIKKEAPKLFERLFGKKKLRKIQEYKDFQKIRENLKRSLYG
jgi:predicted RNA-binding Zn-ribbon protein involved in translation (DUF1610 family)